MSFKKQIPWYIKIIIKVVLSRLPIGYGTWRRAGMFLHGTMENGNYALDVFSSHMKALKLNSNQLDGQHLLELGPGDSIASAVIGASYGAVVTMVDSGDFASEDVNNYFKLADSLSEIEGGSVDLQNSRSRTDILKVCGGRYFTNGLASLKSIESESIDGIYSHAVLEHIPLSQFKNMFVECYRVMKPGSYASHRVDLRDHLGGSINHLRFSEAVWESKFFSESGFYTNRLQYSQILKIFSDLNFCVVDTVVRSRLILPIDRKWLNEIFQDLSDDDLLVTGFDVVLRKD